MMNRLVIAKAAVVGLCMFGFLPAEAAAEERPKFVVIFIDDMGYGDIRPFGPTINRTPQLDRRGEEGLRLTSFYMAAPVCTPSRATLITGCYPKRVGLARGAWGRFTIWMESLTRRTICLVPRRPFHRSENQRVLVSTRSKRRFSGGRTSSPRG